MPASKFPTEWPRHGGALALATERYGAPGVGWLDLSTGINPHPYPFAELCPDDFAHLPDPAATAELTAAARTAYAVPPTVGVAAVPGTEIAIRLLPAIAPAGDIVIVGPTYPSHGAAWQAAGRRISDITTLDDVPATVSIVAVCNPNNPDGRIAPASELLALARTLAARRGLLIVDEAFTDLVPGASLVPRLADVPVVVLRSFGKFFGLAGLRLGFAIGPAPLIDRLTKLLGDWPVSGPAIAIGRAALADRQWQVDTRTRLQSDMAELRRVLADRHLRIAGGTDLFVLVDDPDARAIHRALAAQGVWTRVFADRPRWLRLGLPPGASGLARLDRALDALPTA